MSFTSLIFETIDMRSFSNLWYWIGLAVMWSVSSHWILGVPFDMVLRARRAGPGSEAAEDLVDLARIGVLRTLRVARIAGVWITGIAAFLLTGMIVLGFGYGVEFAQALFFMIAPLFGLQVLALRTARKIRAEDPDLARLCQMLHRHRVMVQVIGMAMIFVTSMYGMIVNLTLPTWY